MVINFIWHDYHSSAQDSIFQSHPIQLDILASGQPFLYWQIEDILKTSWPLLPYNFSYIYNG